MDQKPNWAVALYHFSKNHDSSRTPPLLQRMERIKLNSLSELSEIWTTNWNNWRCTWTMHNVIIRSRVKLRKYLRFVWHGSLPDNAIARQTEKLHIKITATQLISIRDFLNCCNVTKMLTKKCYIFYCFSCLKWLVNWTWDNSLKHLPSEIISLKLQNLNIKYCNEHKSHSALPFIYFQSLTLNMNIDKIHSRISYNVYVLQDVNMISEKIIRKKL